MNLLVEVAIQENARAVSGSFYIVKNNHVCGPWANVIDGPFKGFDGTISEIDTVKGKIKVMVSMFGRDTPVELDALQVKKA